MHLLSWRKNTKEKEKRSGKVSKTDWNDVKKIRTKSIKNSREKGTFEVVAALSSLLFMLVIDMLSKDIKNEHIWELLYANNHSCKKKGLGWM